MQRVMLLLVRRQEQVEAMQANRQVGRSSAQHSTSLPSRATARRMPRLYLPNAASPVLAVLPMHQLWLGLVAGLAGAHALGANLLRGGHCRREGEGGKQGAR